MKLKAVWFRSGTKKTIEAVGVFLRLERSRSMERLRLLKLLYIADRESLKRTGRPIIGGPLTAMDNGPLHSEVYNLIKGAHSDEALWSEFFVNDRHCIEMKKDPSVSALSRFEVNILTEVAEQFAFQDVWEVARQTHEFPEYEKNKPPQGSSRRIPVEDLLEAVGRVSEKDEIVADAEEAALMNRIFGESE